MSDQQFLCRFAAESEEILLPIFKEFANRFKNAIAIVKYSPNATGTDMARVLAKISACNMVATNAAVLANVNTVLLANGDYEVFRAEMIRIYQESLETQYADFGQEEHMIEEN